MEIEIICLALQDGKGSFNHRWFKKAGLHKLEYMDEAVYKKGNGDLGFGFVVDRDTYPYADSIGSPTTLAWHQEEFNKRKALKSKLDNHLPFV